MSYWQFLALFLVIPFSVLLVWCWRWLNLRFASYLGSLVVIALIFTIPFDNYAISQGIWGFNPQRFSGITFFKIPLEEYFFYLLWIAGASLLTLGCWHWFKLDLHEKESPDVG